MTVNAAVEAALPELRREAESRMLDQADIQYPTGGTTQDPDTGSEVLEYATELTTRCRIKSTRTYGVLTQEVGGRTAQTVTREFHMPVDSPAVRAGARVVMTVVHRTSDPSLSGAVLTLGGPAPGSQTTARRIEITEVVS